MNRAALFEMLPALRDELWAVEVELVRAQRDAESYALIIDGIRRAFKARLTRRRLAGPRGRLP